MILAAARKLWLAPLLVLQHSSLLSTATVQQLRGTARNRAAADLQKLMKLADLGTSKAALQAQPL